MKACQPQGVGKSSGFHAQLPATKCKTGHAWPCELMRGHDWSCMLMRGHAWPCMVMRGHACTVDMRARTHTHTVVRGVKLLLTYGHLAQEHSRTLYCSQPFTQTCEMPQTANPVDTVRDIT